jgi:hypothetical protein
MAEDALAVYRSLASMDAKIALLANPYGPVPPQLIPRLEQLRGTYLVQASWPSNGQPNEPFTLRGELPDRLEQVRQHLDRWWSGLDPDVKSHLIEHRNKELDERYEQTISAAEDNSIGLVVVLVHDNKTRGFRLPPLLDVYVEMKARGL